MRKKRSTNILNITRKTNTKCDKENCLHFICLSYVYMVYGNDKYIFLFALLFFSALSRVEISMTFFLLLVCLPHKYVEYIAFIKAISPKGNLQEYFPNKWHFEFVVDNIFSTKATKAFHNVPTQSKCLPYLHTMATIQHVKSSKDLKTK